MAKGMHQAKQPVSALLTGPCGHPLHPHAGDRADRAWLASLGGIGRGHVAARAADSCRGELT